MVLHFDPFPIYSITTILLIGIALNHYLLFLNPDVVDKHFTSSSRNIIEGRWYTLVTSSFAHKDIYHLFRNLTAILVTMPIIEQMMNLKEIILFLTLASIFSSLTSLQFYGGPSIGASGMVYAMDGYLMKIYGLDAEFIPYALEQALFAFANSEAKIDHLAHFGGFIFGFNYKNFSVSILSKIATFLLQLSHITYLVWIIHLILFRLSSQSSDD